MNKRFLAEAFAILCVAIICAVVANVLAGRERKLDWVGDYPRALTAPAKTEEQQVAKPVEPEPVAHQEIETPDTAPKEVKETTAKPEPETKQVTPEASAKQFPPHPERPWVDITSGDAWTLFKRGAPFLDARRTADYAEGHVAGARSLAVWEGDIDEKLAILSSEGLPPDSPIVVYCSGGNCEDSMMLAEKLFLSGYSNALVYKDGFPDWQAKGRPVERGLPK